MTQGDYNRLRVYLGVLKEVAAEYRGKTIENVIQQLEARKKEFLLFLDDTKK